MTVNDKKKELRYRVNTVAEIILTARLMII